MRDAPVPTPPRTLLHDPPPLADSCLRSSGRAMTRWAGAAAGATSGRSGFGAEAAPFGLWGAALVSAQFSCGHVPCGRRVWSACALERSLGCEVARIVQVSVSLTSWLHQSGYRNLSCAKNRDTRPDGHLSCLINAHRGGYSYMTTDRARDKRYREDKGGGARIARELTT